MKRGHPHIFILITTVALLAMLVIQFFWILQTARVKEELFNEKANMVLSRTADALSNDRQTCKSLQISAGKEDVRKVDSLFNHFMQVYHIQIRYSFEVKPGKGISQGVSTAGTLFQPGSYTACVSGADDQGLELKLIFPDKKQFILAEMGPVFITSVILILLVLVLSGRTILSLLKEKIISDHTSEFLNNMTHEFRTPLTNISLAGKMILREGSSGQDEKLRHYTSIILEENEKLRLQVEQVLSMTALERGEIPLTRSMLDIHQIIRDSVKNMQMQTENRQGRINVELNAEKPAVTGDRTHLTNAFSNLIDNALKYSVENPEIAIRTINSGQFIVIEFSDNGAGIDPRYQKRVFDKFFRVPTGDVHDVKGFGLGLSYVRKIFELHGGSIVLESEKGKGTRFIMTLPHA